LIDRRQYRTAWGACVFVAVSSLAAAAFTMQNHDRPVAASRSSAPSYTSFEHATKAHRLECSSCHKFPSDNWQKGRPEADAIPDVTEYPKHESCMRCHMQQFFRGARPAICTICHTDPGPRNAMRHPFPNPRDAFDQSTKGKTHQSDFLPGFPHDKHVEIVTAHRRGMSNFTFASFSQEPNEASCVVCHKTMAPLGKSADEYLTKPPEKLGEAFWLKKGTFKSSPVGHTGCFNCHSADSGIEPAPSSCAKCHHLKPALPRADLDPATPRRMAITDKQMLDNWGSRYSSGTFAHEHFAHVDLSCATCHTVSKINTADPSTRKVPIVSCAGCHATPTTDDGGVINYEVDQRKKTPTFQCVKCHITSGKLAVPASHTEALKAATGK
jgi:hypothetical protein